MTAPPAAVTDARCLSDLYASLSEVTDRGMHFEGGFTPWRDHFTASRKRAAALRERLDPVRPPHVGVLLPNVPEFSFLFGAAALGAFVLVGLNSTRRGAALAADVARADCQIVIVSDETAELIPADLPVPVLNVDGAEWAETVSAASSDGFAPAPVRPDDLVMLIFTSGTTGDPKAVRCSQRKFGAPGVMLAQRFGLGPDDVAYLSMPMFHSNSLIAGWSVAVAAGASIVLRRKFSATGFCEDVRRYGVTYANYVGKPLRYVLATPERDDDARSTLRLVYGNEAGAADRTEFARRFGARVVDGFGSTEGGVSITRTADTPDDALGPLTAPNAVVDPDTLEPVAAGRIGEIVNTAGAGLFDGYYGDEEATAQRLRGGVYRTGDLGWVDDDGYVHFAGRLGDWLRVDGENLGTRPIEQILLRHRLIADATVLGVPDDIGDAVGAVLVAPGLTRESLVEFLKAQTDLGPKQWPTLVWLTDSQPETATFKTARAALAASLGEPTWRLAG
ncbi:MULTISPECIES: AMP-binding protein [Gordonia]|uniref:Long-chain fatty-acid--CoA ligase FadD n=1 Tax=Gordonia sihwensis NBRC 108236 TaxID=1223544 RepID=L7LDX8_9ACTN|nr:MULTISPECIES: AMP-binding protein [Gordonia]AUH67115.1 acyl-CoA synthetase [Gordonia sp. YC-JH1]MBY4569130.1 acyl-CoA synthetase [Gordonia sihwensis]WFN93242.1 AMP-binding protein [Gordonia sihwensis]GAC59094.1 long-chain fatty-acid--CoA ligase FadD [Gordonia sihwensis NBRC 108236]